MFTPAPFFSQLGLIKLSGLMTIHFDCPFYASVSS